MTTLLIDYTFDFAFMVPLRALKNRHWILASMSSMLLLICLPLPPLHSGLFALSEISVTDFEVETVHAIPMLRSDLGESSDHPSVSPNKYSPADLHSAP